MKVSIWNLLKTIKNFGKISRPLIQTKLKEKIALAENDEIISNDIEVAKTSQNFFNSIVENLNIPRDKTDLYKTIQDNLILLACIEKLCKHRCIDCNILVKSVSNTAWKVPVFGVILVLFSRIRAEYGEILRISLYSVRMRENANQNNSEYGHILRSEKNVWKQLLTNSFLNMNKERNFLQKSKIGTPEKLHNKMIYP